MQALFINAHSALAQLGAWLTRIPAWLFYPLLTLIAAFKTTFNWSGSFLGAAADAFPAAQGELSTNFLGIAIYRWSNGSPTIFLGLSVVATVAASLLIFRFQRQRTRDVIVLRVTFILAVSWPVLMSNLTWLGTGNAFFPLFIVMVVLGTNRAWVAIGVLGAVATHPEQSLAAGVAMLVLTLARPFALWRAQSLALTIPAGLVTGATALWLTSAGVPGRLARLDETLGDGLRASIRNGVLGAFAWWGVWWVVVFLVLVNVSRRDRLVIFLAAIVVPGAFIASTLDGTRVFTGVASATGLALMAFVIRPSEENPEAVPATTSDAIAPARSTQHLQASLPLAYFFGALVVLPNLQYAMWSDPVPRPGTYWFGLVENYGPNVWNYLINNDDAVALVFRIASVIATQY